MPGRVRLWGHIVVAALLSVTLASCNCENTLSNTLKVAVVLNVGERAYDTRALEWAKDNINASGGVMGGQPIELVYYEAESAIRINALARDLADDDSILGVIGPGKSAELKAMARSFKQEVQKLEKRVHKEHKALAKKARGKRRRQADPNAPPSGFAKPGPVSDELRAFLKLGPDELIARTEVTKKITEYCKAHNLQKAEDKRTINVDTALKKLLRLKKGDELTFFNLQKYMKVHYPNKEGVFSN